jgi:3-oxoacyl-[acyl-carrier-protein] synthase II
MESAREVVFTGLGVVSPIGIGHEAFWSSLIGGQSGVGPIRSFPATRMPVAFGAELKDFDARQYVKPRKALKVMCRELQTGVSAAQLAAQHADLQPDQILPERLGVVFGSEMLYGDVRDFTALYQACSERGELSMSRYAREFSSRMNPLWMLKNLPNMAACHVGIALDARGASNTIVSGEASGLLALIEAARVIQRNQADMMIVGATGTRVGLTGWMYRGDIGLSHRSDNPQAASRPFDADRDGMVNGEGAAAVVLESRAHAERRGAVIRAALAGGGASMAPRCGVAAQQQAIEQAVHAALESAGWRDDHVGHVNAHGLSDIDADQAEAQAIRTMLGNVPVIGLKSYFGNVGPAGSLLELIGSILSLQHELLPATLNYQTPDPRCPIHVVQGRPIATPASRLLKISFSSTGQTAAVAVEK